MKTPQGVSPLEEVEATGVVRGRGVAAPLLLVSPRGWDIGFWFQLGFSDCIT